MNSPDAFAEVTDLEFIQCQYCEKKYSVNDKLRTAAGKQIRCKHCNEVFEIVIHDDDQTPEPELNTEPVVSEPTIAPPSVGINEETETDTIKQPPEDAQASEDQTQTEEQPAKKKINFQALLSIALGITLICASLGGYLFLNKPELFGKAKPSDPQAIIPQKLVNPMAAGLPNPITIEKTKSPPDRDESRHSLQLCKHLSADYWVRTHLLGTAKLDTNTYLALLDMNLEQAQEIRKFCKDQSLVAKLSEAARTDKKPQWIKTEIESRLKTTSGK